MKKANNICPICIPEKLNLLRWIDCDMVECSSCGIMSWKSLRERYSIGSEHDYAVSFAEHKNYIDKKHFNQERVNYSTIHYA